MREAARAITEIFTEVIIAPDATEEAIAIVGAKKNLRLLLAGGLPDPRAAGLTVKSVAGGLLVQSRDNAVVDDMQLKVVTKRAPTDAELADLRFAFRVAKHVKSNTIVYAKDRATVGIGAGQMSRVDFRAHRGAQGRGRREGAEAAGAADQGLGGRLRRVLPVRRRPAGRDRGRRDRRDPARRLDARRRGDQGRRRARHRHGVHRRRGTSGIDVTRLTHAASSAPTLKNTTSTAMPARWLAVAAVTMPTSSGAEERRHLARQREQAEELRDAVRRREPHQQRARRRLQRAGGEADQQADGDDRASRPAPRTGRRPATGGATGDHEQDVVAPDRQDRDARRRSASARLPRITGFGPSRSSSLPPS